MTKIDELHSIRSDSAAKLHCSNNCHPVLKTLVLCLSHTVAFLAGAEFACYLMLTHGGGR